MKRFVVFFVSLITLHSFSQELIENFDIDALESNQIHHFWLKLVEDGLGQSISIPVLIAKGNTSHPVLGLTAAIHGNELNGIKVIHNVFDEIDIKSLNGTIVAIPGLNEISINQDKRRFIDDEDLNRSFPGKMNGNRTDQYAYHITNKILTKLDYLIDMHTASFGRVNSLYVRADLTNETIKQMAFLQDADIVLNSKGPSAGETSSEARTMRAEAMAMTIPTITIEYGDPQIFQNEMISRGIRGVKNTLAWLNMQTFDIEPFEEAIVCRKSYWIYVDQGGLLEVPVALNQIIEKDDVIGILSNAFGDVIKTYKSPERGIVIGKSSNPINMSGGRIIHLGIIEDR